MDNSDPIKLRIQNETLKEKLKHSEEINRQRELDLQQALADLQAKETEITKITIKYDNLRRKWGTSRRDLKHTQDLLEESRKRISKKRAMVKLLAFLASVLFLLSSVLGNLGTSMLTLVPPNSLGWLMIGLAIGIYVIAAIMILVEGGNS